MTDHITTAAVRARATQLRSRIAAVTDRRVEVVCVTKGHTASTVSSALEAGFTELGESYAQELVAKSTELSSIELPVQPRWHFIGRLQRNKVRQVAPLVDLWHTLDRASLAQEVARRAPGARVLVQVDLAGLPDRGGCPPGEAADLVARCSDLGLDVEGLMGVGAPGPPEVARPGFRRLRELTDDLSLETCCMGMSDDLEVALEEGSTMLRVGRALVGDRPDR